MTGTDRMRQPTLDELIAEVVMYDGMIDAQRVRQLAAATEAIIATLTQQRDEALATLRVFAKFTKPDRCQCGPISAAALKDIARLTKDTAQLRTFDETAAVEGVRINIGDFIPPTEDTTP